MSVKLSDDLYHRLVALAGRSGLTRHAIMKDAIEARVLRMEAEDWLAGHRPDDDDDAAGDRALFTYEALTPGTGLTETMAAQIAAVRSGRGFNTLRLASRLNDLGIDIDERVIAEIEDGRATPSAELLAALAKALGVSADALVA